MCIKYTTQQTTLQGISIYFFFLPLFPLLSLIFSLTCVKTRQLQTLSPLFSQETNRFQTKILAKTQQISGKIPSQPCLALILATMCGGRMVSFFTHMKPHAFIENQAKRMKKDSGAWRLRMGSWWSVERNNSQSLSLIVFPLIWVQLINPWLEFLVNGLASYFL